MLAALLVPVGMGYAEAAGLPAIYGLYATIAPLVVYAVIGPSRVLVLGPDSALAAVIAAVILPLAAGDQARAVSLAGMLAILTGSICAIAAIGRVGFVTDLLSLPIRYGYLNGVALTVAVSQLPKLFGFSVDTQGLWSTADAFARGVIHGDTVVPALAIGAGSLALLVVLKRVAPAVPGALVAMIVGIGAVALWDLAAHGVPVVGRLPRGLPGFVFPDTTLADLWPLLVGAFGISLVALADTSVLSRTLATREGAFVDPNDELFALGGANVAAGLFQGFPVSSSASRTPAAMAAGARTQLTPLIGAGLIACMLVVAPGLLRELPLAVLAAVVIDAAWGLAEIGGVRRLARLRRSEFLLSMGSFGAVALLGVLPGIFVAILLSLGNFIRRAWRPHAAVLGRVEDLKGYHDVARFPEAKLIPGLLLYRFDAPLFFANAAGFRKGLMEEIDRARPVRWVVVAAEPMTDVDSTAEAVLSEFLDELAALGVELAFAEMKDPVKDRLRRSGLMDRIGQDRFFPTMGVAVAAYLAHSGVEWVDWEERQERDKER
jgi:high affinity sulfate transporter 1